MHIYYAMYKNMSLFKTLNLLRLSQSCSMCTTKSVRPMMSTDLSEARLRALGLYRAAYRYLPYIVKYYDIPKNVDQCRWMLRSLFYKNANVKDLRVIDLLIIKGSMELKELTQHWQSKGHVFRHWEPTIEPKCRSFLAKFIEGN